MGYEMKEAMMSRDLIRLDQKFIESTLSLYMTEYDTEIRAEILKFDKLGKESRFMNRFFLNNFMASGCKMYSFSKTNWRIKS